MSIRNYYETYWSPEGFRPSGALATDLARLYAMHIDGAAHVLDVGCGDGLTSGLWALEHAASYTGVDISAPAVDAACANGLSAQLIDDAASLPFEDGSFDNVLAIEVYEHLFDPLAAAVEAFRVLRPSGVMLVTVPHIAHWKQRADLALRGRWDPKGDDLGIDEPWRDPHIRFFTVAALERMLRHAGFAGVYVGAHRGSIVANFRLLSRYARLTPGKRGRQFLERHPSMGAGLYAIARKAR